MSERITRVRLIVLSAAGLLSTAITANICAEEFDPLAEPARIYVPDPDTLPNPPAPSAEEESTDGPVFLRDDSTGFDYRADRVYFDDSLEPEQPTCESQIVEGFLHALSGPADHFAHFYECLLCAEHDEPHSALEDHPIGIQPIPGRPELLAESGESFLAPGKLEQGIELPTGAVWRPSFWLFGTYRTGLSYVDVEGGPTFSEWSTRLDLFGQVNLSGTERVLVGMRPLDKERSARRSFTSYDFRDGKFIDGVNADFQTLFFEGDIGEIFPNWDPYDSNALDYGFSVGRQPMSFQQGLLINEDMIDALTVTRNTLFGDGNLNLRATGVYAWSEISRNNGVRDQNAQMFGLFTESDFEVSTVNADFAYVSSESRLGSLMAFGLSAIQRIPGYENVYNSSFHALASFPTEGETVASGQGVLLFGQSSWTPHHTNDLVYLNGFWAIDQFTSPARGPLMGGPLGQTGILFAAPGLGRFGAPISNQASRAAGGSLGYQLFFDHTEQQVVIEVGGRKSTDGRDDGALGTGTRWQKKLDQHWILIVDAFLTKREGFRVTPGTRIELLAKF